ncbi:MAG: fused MFS/spermidine synthase [Chloroflexia bacterium]|nr:fused MFS/spermidine synthase [Chloroflexia bacterium]
MVLPQTATPATTNATPAVQTFARSRVGDVFIQLLVFFGGVTSVGTEIAASRLVAPYFGSSTFIWANLIGLTLTYLSLGYWLGGKVADRYPRAWLLYTLTAIAAIWAGLIPYLSRPILSASLRAFDQLAVGAFYGSLVGVLLLFLVPITLLGFVTPYAIRLRLADVHRAGNVAGNTYALSTVGSILGSFLPVLVLIPWIGTTRTFLVLALLLLVPSLLGLIRLRAVPQATIAAALGVALAMLPLVADFSVVRPAERGRLVYETESAENYIQVLEEDGRMLLALNDGHAIHSIYDPDELLTGGPWDYFMVGPLFNQGAGVASVDRALLIGLAGGTVAHQLTAAYGPIPIDGVEIDPEIVRVGRDYFAMDEAHLPNLNAVVADGRYFLRTTEMTYDLIGVDAYRQPYIPFQLTTKEFFGEVSNQLSPEGVAVINAGKTDTDFRLVDVIASTMKSVFPNVYLIDVDRFDNTIIVGTKTPADLNTFAQSVEGLPDGSVLRRVGESSLASGNIREQTTSETVFTDDHAPVERVVDQIILDAAREESNP